MGYETKREQAEEAYQIFCDALDSDDWKYGKNDGELKIEFGVQGENLPINVIVNFDVDKHLVLMLSHLPFTVAENKRVDLAVAICAVNNMMVDGCFDYDVESGYIFFRITNSYLDSVLSERVCLELTYKACRTVDAYNDKFLMLSKGVLSIEQFLTSING